MLKRGPCLGAQPREGNVTTIEASYAAVTTPNRSLFGWPSVSCRLCAPKARSRSSKVQRRLGIRPEAVKRTLDKGSAREAGVEISAHHCRSRTLRRRRRWPGYSLVHVAGPGGLREMTERASSTLWRAAMNGLLAGAATR